MMVVRGGGVWRQILDTFNILRQSPVSITRQHGPCWRVMETGHPSTRAVNLGRQLG